MTAPCPYCNHPMPSVIVDGVEIPVIGESLDDEEMELDEAAEAMDRLEQEQAAHLVERMRQVSPGLLPAWRVA